jgi:hypothetical protein
MGAMGAYGLDALQVRFGDFLGLIVGMAHLVPAERAFAADCTCSSHVVTLRKRKVID